MHLASSFIFLATKLQLIARIIHRDFTKGFLRLLGIDIKYILQNLFTLKFKTKFR